MRKATMAGLNVEIVGEEHVRASPVIVLLHGYDGFASDLSPFASSFGLPFRFVFPEAVDRPDGTARGGRAWWPIDDEGRNVALARGQARDLSLIEPPGLPRARAAISRLLDEIEGMFGPAPLMIGGFSQGAMLSCDLRCGRAALFRDSYCWRGRASAGTRGQVSTLGVAGCRSS